MLDLIISGLASLIGGCMDGFCQIVLPILSFNFDAFANTFPFAGVAFRIIQSIAVGIVLLLSATQTIPFLVGSKYSRSSPVRIGLFAIIAIAAIFYGNYILEGIMRIAQAPYTALLSSNLGGASADLSDISLASVFAIAHDVAYSTSVLLYIFLIILIGVSFIKLLLEAVERYVVLFVLLYLSPLAASGIASESTIGVSKRYLTMFFSQCLLLILNVWSLKMINSLFVNLALQTDKMMSLLLGYALLRIASRFDSYLNTLGLSAAVTGAGLGSELLASGMMMISKISGHGGSGNVKSSGNNFSRMADSMASISPISAISMQTKNGVKAAARSVKDAFGDAKAASENGTSGLDAFQKSIQESIRQNMDQAAADSERIGGVNRMIFGSHHANSAVSAAMSGSSLSDSDYATIANNPHVADAAFRSPSKDTEIADPSVVSSVMAGIGLQNYEHGSDVLGVVSGTTPSENLVAGLNQNGIQASYSSNGKTHQWEIKNQNQINSLSPSEQQGYTSFRSKNGSVYYAKHTVGQTPSETQKQRNDYAALYNGFSDNNRGITLRNSSRADCINAWNAHVPLLKDSGIPTATIKDAQMALENSQDGAAAIFECNARGMNLIYSDNSNRTHQIIAKTEAGIEAEMKSTQMDRESYMSNLHNKGYRPAVVDGKKSYILNREFKSKHLDEIDMDGKREYL